MNDFLVMVIQKKNCGQLHNIFYGALWPALRSNFVRRPSIAVLTEGSTRCCISKLIPR